jgi:hypothetical protein
MIMRKTLGTAVVMMAAGSIALGASTTAGAHNGSQALRVCAVQHSAHNRGQCLSYWHKGTLRKVPPGLARDITGKRQAAYAHYGDTTYVFAANGRRYVS